MEQITIAGQLFNVPVRYEEGHELTAGEASALNQTYHENIRNNLAGKIKKGEAIDQAAVDAYASEYQFGVRSGGGSRGPADPVMSEALRIAKKQVGEMLKKAGKKASDYTSETITAAAHALIGKDAKIMDLARQRVAEQQSLATEDLGDLLAGLAPKPAEAPAPSPEPQA